MERPRVAPDEVEEARSQLPVDQRTITRRYTYKTIAKADVQKEEDAGIAMDVELTGMLTGAELADPIKYLVGLKKK